MRCCCAASAGLRLRHRLLRDNLGALMQKHPQIAPMPQMRSA
jgi:hypothetical protein